MLYTFVQLFFLVGAVLGAKVPQVKLCDRDDCPYVSRIGLGTLHLGDAIGGLSDPVKINELMVAAVEQGITLIDCADVYPVKGGTSGDSAKLLGQAMALTPGLREQLTIVAKMDIIFPNTIDTSREHLSSTVDWFLDALQTDYLDIVLLHYSNSFLNAEEVAELFIELKAAGTVHHFGVSNHYPSKFDLFQSVLQKKSLGDISLVTNEIEVSVWNPGYMNYDNSLVDHSYTNGYRILGWGGLGGDPIGGLNRLFQRKGSRQFEILRALATVGDELGEKDESVVALAWTLSHPAGIIPLIGTTRIDRLQNLISALDLAGRMTTAQWWSIANKGGLCPLGDSQCNYDEYKA